MGSLADSFRHLRARLLPRRPAPPRPSPALSWAELLGRPAVNLDTPELQRFLAAKRVLVTGAGGSIGSEICRQAMKFCPERLLMVERAENALFEIDRELRHTWIGADIKPLVADVCDARRVESVFRDERPQVVFHCAAHKHVPMMEANPGEAIKNNVFGTRVVADAALAAGAQAFVLISTDKAVNPSSVMGASKRVAELYVQSLNQSGQWPVASGQKRERKAAEDSGPSLATDHRPLATRFLAVRFGNVIGSSGSVLPIFQKQIEAGGPVTVTHPQMRRYFMTIPEASQLVMQAGAIGRGGEIFVLDMGQPVRILDLAHEMIRRNGLRPGEDIAVQFTGCRPGEKLFEELAGADEPIAPTSHPKIRVWQLPTPNPQQVAAALDALSGAIDGTPDEAIAALARCVPEYRRHADGEPMTPTPPSETAPLLRLVKTDNGDAVAA